MANIKSNLWVETYRPKTVADIVLPKEFKKYFNNIVKTGELPNLLLCSPVPRYRKNHTGQGTCSRFEC